MGGMDINTEQQDRLWNDLSEEKKEKYRKDYKDSIYDCGESALIERRELLAEIFGTHNLNPKPQIKTWEDVEDNYVEYQKYVAVSNDIEEGIINIEDKLRLKFLATYRIAKLIDLGYGGIPSEAEWMDGNVEIWSVIYMPFKKQPEIMANSHRKEFVSFHSKELAEEFMSHESNRKLVEMYYCI